jgi:hypothetical protein
MGMGTSKFRRLIQIKLCYIPLPPYWSNPIDRTHLPDIALQNQLFYFIKNSCLLILVKRNGHIAAQNG